MSEQVDGFLQMGASYNFDRSKVSNYKNNTIASDGFQKWTQPNMYKSSYAHFHSKVLPFLLRTRSSPKTQPFPATAATSLPSRPKIYMPEATRPWPSKVSTKSGWAATPTGCLQPASIWTATPLSIGPNLHPAASTARLKSRELILAGM